MSEIPNGSAESSLKLPVSKMSSIFLGFGYYRNRHGEPWFKYRDLTTVTSELPSGRFITPTKSHYSKMLSDYIGLGLAEGRESEPGQAGRRSPQSLAKVTEEGEELLLQSTTYLVTHRGLTIPAIFPLPEVAHTIEYDSDLYQRVHKYISGLGGLAVNQ